ncbi:MAG: PilN domain-containing protein [Nitrospirae bacterium]|nr:PilN domain-containing protein [Nitrospirota bacterium]MDA1302890.1 PilN domain-containing protein [Nitrospirota bacterium]
MIEINLLRSSLDKERGLRQRCKSEAVVVLCLFLGLVLVCGFVWVDFERTLAQLHSQKNLKAAQLVELKRRHEQFEIMNRQTADLVNRSQQVIALAAQQRQPLQLLDAVSRSLDPLNIWLAKLEMKREQVTLVGFAQTRNQIVQFSRNLKGQELFQSVAVLETGKKTRESSLYPFTMNLLLMSELHAVSPS